MKRMNKLEIAAKIRAGKTFTVPGKRERDLAYIYANFIDVEITAATDKDTGRVTIKFVTP